MPINSCRFGLLAALLSSLSLVSAPALAQTPISLDSITPRYSAANLSPDGQFVAIATPADGGDRVAVFDIANPGNQPLAYPIDGAIVNDILWRGNDALIMQVYGRFTIVPTPIELAILAFPKTAERPKQITYRELASQRRTVYGSEWWFSSLSDVVDLMPDTTTHFYMAALVRRPPQGYNFFGGQTTDIWARDLLRVEADTGVATIETMGNEQTAQWILDGRGNVLARIDVTTAGNQTVYVPDGDRLSELTSISGNALSGGQFLGLSHDGNALILQSIRGSDVVLSRLELATGEIGEPIYSGISYLGVMKDRNSLRIVGVRYADGLMSKIRYFVPEYEPAQAVLENAIPNTSITITAASDDRQQFLFEAHGPSRPPVLGFYDAEKRSVSTIAEMYPQIVQTPLGEIRQIPYPNTDGGPLGGVLALPPGVDPVNLPAVILDDTRTDLEFDVLGHFLTSRGYAVLRPGVTQVRSFGELSEPGDLEQWVTNYQNSVAAGMNALVSEGIADPQRVCIIGTGENGYAALMTVVNNPDMFACAVGVNGLYDLPRAVNEARQDRNLAVASYYSALVRNQGRFSEEDLERFSPVNFADSINAAVLIVGDDRDGQTAIMVSELEDADKDVDYAELEDNYLDPANNRFANDRTEYAAIEEFLAEHIAP